MSAGVHARAGRMCHSEMSKWKSQIGNETRRCEWRHARKRWGFWGFEKSQLVEFLPPNERDEIGTWARPDDFVCYGGCALVGLRADNVKAVSIERLCISLHHVEKPFNSKVIKSFVPELRIRKCFCVSGFLCYLYMSYEHSMYISHIHVWLCNRHRLTAYVKKRKEKSVP